MSTTTSASISVVRTHTADFEFENGAVKVVRRMSSVSQLSGNVQTTGTISLEVQAVFLDPKTGLSTKRTLVFDISIPQAAAAMRAAEELRIFLEASNPRRKFGDEVTAEIISGTTNLRAGYCAISAEQRRTFLEIQAEFGKARLMKKRNGDILSEVMEIPRAIADTNFNF